MNIVYLRKSLAIAKVVGLSLVLNACAGVHLHNERNAENANTAAESFKTISAEIDAEFEKQTKNQQAILDEELAAVAKFTRNDRDAALVIVAVSDDPLSKVWIEGMFEKRFKKIGVQGNDLKEYAKKIEEMAKLRKETLQFDNKLKKRQGSLRDMGYTGDLICTVEEAAPPINENLVTKLLDAQPKEDRVEIKTALTDTYKEFKDSCAKWRNGGLDKYFDDDGEFKTVLNNLKKARRDEREAKVRVDKVRAAFDKAAEKLKKRTPKDSEKKPSEIISEQINQLHSIVKGASSALAALSAESKIVNERLSAVDQVLAIAAKGGEKEGDKKGGGAASGSETAPNKEEEKLPELKGTEKRVALVLAGLPNLADGFSNLSQTLNRPPLTALIMAKGELQARFMAINAEMAREKAKIALINEQYNALVDELSAYNMVFVLINTAGRSAFDSTYKELMTSANGEKQRAAKAAIALQIQSESRSLRRRFQAEYRMIALDYQATKELSRARVAQWNAMLGPLISQQKAYHDSGIKRENVASLAVELLKALGLFAIASEAN